MSKVCKNCGTNVEKEAFYCKKCGKPLSVISFGSKHEIHKNKYVEYELCRAEEEAAITSSIEKTYENKKVSWIKGHKFVEVLLNKIILALLILCIIATPTFFLLSKYKETTSNMLTEFLPKKQTSSYILFQMKNIKELQALKLSKADFYQYKDEKNRKAELIIRYYISINFNLDDSEIIQKDDGSFIIELKKPQVLPYLINNDIEYTEKKLTNQYTGIEIFSISNSWKLGPDFKMGEVTNIAQKYISNESIENAEYYTQEGFTNIKEKLMAISTKLNLNISDIRLEGVNE